MQLILVSLFLILNSSPEQAVTYNDIYKFYSEVKKLNPEIRFLTTRRFYDYMHQLRLAGIVSVKYKTMGRRGRPMIKLDIDRNLIETIFNEVVKKINLKF